MPPVCKLPRDIAIDLLVEAGGKFSDWRVSVKEDRGGILTEARKKLNAQPLNFLQKEAPAEETDNETNDESIAKERDSEEDNNEADFDLNDDRRTTHTLRPKVWANVVSLAFWKQWRLPCAFVFKRGEVNVSDNRLHFIKIQEVCRSKKCNNSFRGYVDKEPSSLTEELLIRVKTRDTSGEVHELVRRPLNGKRRRQLGKAALSEGSANNVKKQLARENLRRGDIGGPNEPSLDVLRHAKKEAIAEELGTNRVKNEDMIQTIERMKYEKEFMGSIIDTGY
nr:PREDICTED: uncharacterized protein LOC105272867 [Fopius arisanus]